MSIGDLWNWLINFKGIIPMWPPPVWLLIVLGILLLWVCYMCISLFLTRFSMLREHYQLLAGSNRETLSSMRKSDRGLLDESILHALWERKVELSSLDLCQILGRDLNLVFEAVKKLTESKHLERSIRTSYSHTVLDNVKLTDRGHDLHGSYAPKGNAIHMGDIISVGDNAMVVNRSEIRQSVVGLSGKLGDDRTDALRDLADIVLQSGNPEAI